MAKLVFGMNMSLDGYVDHDHDAFAPDPVMFKYFIEQTRKAAGSIYGRGLYEVMRYWDGDNWDQTIRRWATICARSRKRGGPCRNGWCRVR